MQQIVVVHGGTTFKDNDAYLAYLSTKPVSIDRLVSKLFWKERLQETLGDDYQVLLPSMPNKTNARYSEWAAWFTNISQVFTDDVILIGHSMGAIFLAKYLSENVTPYKIKGTVLIATPYDDESTEDLSDFKIESLTDALSEQAGRLVIINGEDDPVIDISDIEKYKQALSDAEFMTISAPDHFVREEFPELVSLIHEISTKN